MKLRLPRQFVSECDFSELVRVWNDWLDYTGCLNVVNYEITETLVEDNNFIEQTLMFDSAGWTGIDWKGADYYRKTKKLKNNGVA